MARADLTKVTILDWVVVSAGLLAYISSFFPWYRAHVSVLGIERSAGANAWNAGIGAWFPVLLLVAAGVVVLVSTVGVQLPSSPLIMLGLSTLAFITILVRWVTYPDASGRQGDNLGNVDVEGLVAVSSGAGFGLYLGLVAAIAAVAASFLTLRSA